MKKKIIIILLLLLNFSVFSQENSKSGFSISLCVTPVLEDGDIPRGLTISWERIMNNFWNLGVASRILNKDYTSFYGTSSIIFKPSLYFQIPVELGTGVKIKQFNLDAGSEDGLNFFLHGSAKLRWFFNPNWSYYISGDYNYNILYSDNHEVYISLGLFYQY